MIDDLATQSPSRTGKSPPAAIAQMCVAILGYPQHLQATLNVHKKSASGTKRTLNRCRPMSAFEGKADIAPASQNVRL